MVDSKSSQISGVVLKQDGVDEEDEKLAMLKTFAEHFGCLFVVVVRRSERVLLNTGRIRLAAFTLIEQTIVVTMMKTIVNRKDGMMSRGLLRRRI
jgi:hypothetical protein